jgi:putative RecB family exonuclease
MLYSHSRLETFESCRLKFKYQYIVKPDVPKRDSVEAYLGTRVHETLEALYKHKLMGKVWSREEFLRHYENIWERNKSDSIYIVNREYDLSHYFRQGYTALENYWDRYYPFDSEKTIALEKRVLISLDDSNRYRLQGYIDRLSRAEDGSWHIRDYKTKRTLPSQQEADQDRQLALYQLGVQELWGDTENVELIWHYLIFDEEIRSVRDHANLEKVRLDTIHLIQEVERAIAADDLPYRESALCDWCDFFDICPAKRHLAKVRQLPPEEFKVDDGVRLVDDYARLKQEEAVVKQKLQLLSEQLKAFAGRNELDKIYGSDRRVNIYRKSTHQVPSTADKERRRELEQILRQHGVWEQVSHFYGPRLIKLYEEGALPEKLRREVSEFITPAVVESLRLSKIKAYDENFEQD